MKTLVQEIQNYNIDLETRSCRQDMRELFEIQTRIESILDTMSDGDVKTLLDKSKQTVLWLLNSNNKI